MAEEQTTPEEPGNGNGSGSNNDTQVPPVKTHNVIDDFSEDCGIKGEAAQADAAVAATTLENVMQAVCGDRRALRKGEATRTFYGELHYNVAGGLSADMATAMKCVEAHVKTSEEVIVAYEKAVAKMKEACTKLENVCRVAKDLDSAVNKSCNSSHKEELNRILHPEVGQDQTPPDTMKTTANSYKETAENLQNQGDTLIEVAVKATGIYSFVNVRSLEQCISDLIAAADAFKADTEANRKKSEDNIKEALKNITNNAGKASEGYFGKAKADAAENAIEHIAENVKIPFPVPSQDYTLDKICRRLSGSSST